MASAQEKQNRRLIEELAQTRQMMISQAGGTNVVGNTPAPGMLGGAAGTTPSSAPRTGASLLGNGIEVTDAQRNARVAQALQAANTNSVGFFVPQDSSFGNLILPVLPRIPPPEFKAEPTAPS